MPTISLPPALADSDRALTQFEHARKVLQDEIDQHKNHIIEKQRQLNTLIPIARLPPELLSEVFIHFAALARDISSPAYPRGRSKRWIQIAHICHYWRNIALSTPRVWSEFTVDKLEWTQEMLARSKWVPLRVKVVAPYATPEALKLMLSELARTEAVEFRGYTVESLGPPFVAPSEAPMLHSLSVVSNRPHFMMSGQPANTLFDGMEMPKLANLELIDTRISWTNPIFKPTITRLTFKSADHWGVKISQLHDMHYVALLASGPMISSVSASRAVGALGTSWCRNVPTARAPIN